MSNVQDTLRELAEDFYLDALDCHCYDSREGDYRRLMEMHEAVRATQRGCAGEVLGHEEIIPF